MGGDLGGFLSGSRRVALWMHFRLLGHDLGSGVSVSSLWLVRFAGLPNVVDRLEFPQSLVVAQGIPSILPLWRSCGISVVSPPSGDRVGSL